MGNRAVLVSHDTNFNNRNEKIGIYLHWFGSEESVKDFLATAKEKKIKNVDYSPSYFWARFTQIIANYISEGGSDELSIGVDVVSHLDCANYDNGVYYIDGNFNIVKHTDGTELEEYDNE